MLGQVINYCYKINSSVFRIRTRHWCSHARPVNLRTAADGDWKQFFTQHRVHDSYHTAYTPANYIALHLCRAVLATSEMSVRRPSVKCVDCDKMKEVLPKFLYRMNECLSYFSGRKNSRWVTTPVPEISGQTDLVRAQTPIFNRYSPVALQP